MMKSSIQAIHWTGSSLQLLDQRRLPHEEVYLDYQEATAVADAIRDMVVRGAPAIGITAAYAVVLAAQQHLSASPGNWHAPLMRDIQRLSEARPTAVNLVWALERMQQRLSRAGDDPVAALLGEAKRIHQEDIDANIRMGEEGAGLIQRGDSVLTYCNTGSLATGGYGTALGVVRSTWAAGKLARVFAGETRPWLQGARLTAWELIRDGIPVTLITDNAAAFLMQKQQVQWVITGADRVAANGDVINKIGTYQLAVVCRYHGVKMMVVAPLSTLDMGMPDGRQVVIEQRPEAEVLEQAGRRIAANGATAWNPAFDVTPATLVDYLVTEAGVITAPDREKLAAFHANLPGGGSGSHN
ncbi:MAG: S-methyl-5-thioribose-1-phosphate isomerase [Gammaproteobacteria bacterium]|jgi:methylthioribose-1-phosphate isomerase|nr:S-methyl-5-thioribose-1-phosphate isomerase [Gammaproteobacteria bacterium]